jgi:hypothetical protein
VYEVWADPGFGRELDKLGSAADGLRAGLDALRQDPLSHPSVVRLRGSGFPGSFRWRIGRLRTLGIALPAPRLVLLTTVFVKKRDSDYEAALRRHDARLAAQGPPLAEWLQRP